MALARRCLWLMALAACAPHLEPLTPISTDRPDHTEGVELVPVGIVQVEGGATTARSGGVRTTSYGEVLVRVGVADRLELRIEPLTHTTVRAAGAPSVGGLDDMAVGFKTPLFTPDSAARFVPDVSLLLATSIPTGAHFLRADGAQPEAVLAAAWSLTSRLGLATNLTLQRGSASGERYWERGASASAGIGLSERAGSYVEWYAIRDSRDDAAAQVFNGGLTWRLSSDLQLDARAGRGTRNEGTFAGIGIARRW